MNKIDDLPKPAVVKTPTIEMIKSVDAVSPVGVGKNVNLQDMGAILAVLPTAPSDLMLDMSNESLTPPETPAVGSTGKTTPQLS